MEVLIKVWGYLRKVLQGKAKGKGKGEREEEEMGRRGDLLPKRVLRCLRPVSRMDLP